MPNLNRVQIIGRLGRDPEEKSTKNGSTYAAFPVAVDRRWRDAEGQANTTTDWFNVETWGRLGEVCQAYLAKGRLVFVEGRLQTDRYEKEGEPRQYTKVVALQMQMLDRRTVEEDAVLDETAETEPIDAQEDTADQPADESQAEPSDEAKDSE